MEVYIKEEKNKRNNNLYYFDELVEEQLYIHNVTASLPKDNRPLEKNLVLLNQNLKKCMRNIMLNRLIQEKI